MEIFEKTNLFLRFSIFIIFGISLAIILYLLSRPDGSLHLIFCDVGQGDGILIVTPSGSQILVDGGVDDKVLACLGSNMPFYDRTIEMMVLTHPQLDHMGGQIDVLRRYRVEKILASKASNNTPEYLAWEREKLNEEAVNFIPKKGTVIKLDENIFAKLLWPADGQFINGQPADLNETSIVFRLDYDPVGGTGFCALLTGDIDTFSQDLIAQSQPQSKCFLLKVPHHGSKNNISKKLWEQLEPQLAIIQAGYNNRFGHPHQETIDSLTVLGSRILRNDQLGTIEVVTDGKTIQVDN